MRESKLRQFEGFQVTADMTSLAPSAIFMHCLPANDKRECTREVMESSNSVIFDEAENRLTAQMALLVYLTHKDSKEASAETIKMHEEKIASFLNVL